MKQAKVAQLGTLVVVVAVGFALAGPPAQKAQRTTGGIAFPTGYRAWMHVKSMVIYDKTHPLYNTFGGIHHVYVNTKGLETLRKGGTYPDGTIFVFDLLEALPQGGAYVEGKRKLLAVMDKSSKGHTATGGWAFEAWAEGDAGKRLVQDATKQCFACHATQKNSDAVYSGWRP